MTRRSAFLFGALLAACSGSGAPVVATLPSSSAAMVVATLAGTELTVTAVVHGAVLERPGGSLVPLPWTPREVVLADPTGRPDAVTLDALPSGPFRTLHLLIEAGRASARTPAGERIEVRLPSADLAVPVAGGLLPQPAPRAVLHLRHRGAVPLLVDGAALAWSPDLELASAAPTAVAETTFTPVSRDDASGDLLGFLVATGAELPVVLRPAPAAVLTAGSPPVLIGAAELRADLVPGTTLVVAGMLHADSVLEASSIHRPTAGQNRVVVRVRSAQGPTQQFVGEVVTVAQGRPLLGATLAVDAGGLRIAPGGAPHRSAGFGFVQPGALVEVAFGGAATAAGVRPDTVQLRGSEAEPMVPEFLATVAGIEFVRARELVVVADAATPSLTGGATVVVTVDPRTTIYRGDPRVPNLLQEVGTGDRVRVRGQLTGPGRIIGWTVAVLPER